MELPYGIAPVTLKIVSNNHIVIEENKNESPIGRCQVAVDATLASFGSSEHLSELIESPPSTRTPYKIQSSRSMDLSPSPSTVTQSNYMSSQSPPGGLPYEMYSFLASRVASSGGDSLQRQHKRRERTRSRAVLKGRQVSPFETEHLVRVIGPTGNQALHGIWKGIGANGFLDFIFVSYSALGSIICRRVAEYEGPISGGERGERGDRGEGNRRSSSTVGSVKWTALAESLQKAPLSPAERCIYERRRHIGSNRLGNRGNHASRSGGREGGMEGERRREVLGASSSSGVGSWMERGNTSDGELRTGSGQEVLQFEDVEVKMYGEEEEVSVLYRTYPEVGLESHVKEGRLWVYASGNLGYGAGHTDYIVDYRRVVVDGTLVDVMDGNGFVRTNR